MNYDLLINEVQTYKYSFCSQLYYFCFRLIKYINCYVTQI